MDKFLSVEAIDKLPIYSGITGKLVERQSMNLRFVNDDTEKEQQVKKRGRPFSKGLQTAAFLKEIFEFDFIKRRFECDFCSRRFKSPQAKGGHISKAHANQSIKYSKKMLVRNNREELRNLREKTIAEFLSQMGVEYEALINETDGKRQIREIIRKEKNAFVKFFNSRKNEKYAY